MGLKEFKLEKSRTGRPPGLTEDVKNKIYYGIGRGAPYELAANYGGVSYNSLLEWIKRGDAHEERIEKAFIDVEAAKEGKDLKLYKKKKIWFDALISHEECMYIEFAHEIRRLRSVDALAQLAKIDAAGFEPKTWAAAAWKLERIYGKNFLRKSTIINESKIDVTSRNANINIDFESEKTTDTDVVNIYKEFLRGEDIGDV